VRELAQISTDGSIASILNRLKYRTGTGNKWTESRVRYLRGYRQIPAFNKAAPRTWLTLAEAAAQLEVPPNRVRKLIEQGFLPARQIVRNAPGLIKPQDLDSSAVRDSLGCRSSRNKQQDNNQSKMCFYE
jgi:hypothetical protein